MSRTPPPPSRALPREDGTGVHSGHSARPSSGPDSAASLVAPGSWAGLVWTRPCMCWAPRGGPTSGVRGAQPPSVFMYK